MSTISVNQAMVPPANKVRGLSEGALMRGVVTGYLSLIVLIPLAAIVWRATGQGIDVFWRAISAPANLPEQRTLTPLAPACMVRNIDCFIARR